MRAKGHAGSAGACTADAGRRPGASPSRNPPPPRRRPYPWCVSRPFGTGTRQMVHRKSRRRTPGAFGNGARRAVPHRKPRTARRTSRRFAAEHVRRYSCAEVTRSERWPRHQAVRCFHYASSVRAASPDARRAQVTSANARREGAQGLAVDQVTEAVAALDISQNMASNQRVSGVWRFHGQGVSPAPLATPRASARRLHQSRGVPRSPRGHKNPRGSRLAVWFERARLRFGVARPVLGAGRLPARHRDDRDSGT